MCYLFPHFTMTYLLTLNCLTEQVLRVDTACELSAVGFIVQYFLCNGFSFIYLFKVDSLNLSTPALVMQWITRTLVRLHHRWAEKSAQIRCCDQINNFRLLKGEKKVSILMDKPEISYQYPSKSKTRSRHSAVVSVIPKNIVIVMRLRPICFEGNPAERRQLRVKVMFYWLRLSVVRKSAISVRGGDWWSCFFFCFLWWMELLLSYWPTGPPIALGSTGSLLFALCSFLPIHSSQEWDDPTKTACLSAYLTCVRTLAALAQASSMTGTSWRTQDGLLYKKKGEKREKGVLIVIHLQNGT